MIENEIQKLIFNLILKKQNFEKQISDEIYICELYVRTEKPKLERSKKHLNLATNYMILNNELKKTINTTLYHTSKLQIENPTPNNPELIRLENYFTYNNIIKSIFNFKSALELDLNQENMPHVESLFLKYLSDQRFLAVIKNPNNLILNSFTKYLKLEI